MQVFFLGAGATVARVLLGSGLNETVRNRKATVDLLPNCLSNVNHPLPPSCFSQVITSSALLGGCLKEDSQRISQNFTPGNFKWGFEFSDAANC